MSAKVPLVVLAVFFVLQPSNSYLQSQVDKAEVQRQNPCKDCEDRLRSVQRQLNACQQSGRSQCDEKTNDLQRRLDACQKNASSQCHERMQTLHLEADRARTSLTACNNKLQSLTGNASTLSGCEARLSSARAEIVSLKHLNDTARQERENFRLLFEAADKKSSGLMTQNAALAKTVDDLKISLGSESAKYAELFAQSKKIEANVSALNATPSPSPLSAATTNSVELTRMLLEADDIESKAGTNSRNTSDSNSNSNSNSNSDSTSPVEYRTVVENGKTYEVRELMIGSLYFPDPEKLNVAPSQPMDIEVIFKPNALLRNSRGDGRTKWFLEFALAPNKLKEFTYQEARSKDKARREVGDAAEEKWIWTIPEKTIPANFTSDNPYVQIDGSAEVDGVEITKKQIENKALEIKEKAVPSFISQILQGIVNYSTVLLALTTGAFGLGTAWFAFQKARLETKLKDEEAQNSAADREAREVKNPSSAASQLVDNETSKE